MNAQQRAVIAAATKDGLAPMEIAAELLCHDLMACLLDQLRKRQVAFAKLSEQEQDSAIADIQADVKKAATTAARVITAQGKETVGAKLKSLKIDGKLTATMIIEGDEPNRHILTDKAHDKSDILIVLYPNGYSEGLSAHQAEKDQKDLPLDDEPAKKGKTPRVSSPTSAGAIAKKAIELTPKQIEDGREFIIKQQNCSPDALQNLLKINRQRAEALLKHFEGEGIIHFVGTEASGQYELVRSGDAPTTSYADTPKYDEATLEVFYATAVKAVLKAGSADDSVLTAIYGDDDNAIEQALVRMEDDGIVSKPSPEGLRAVLTLP